jgi:hypothetical protein
VEIASSLALLAMTSKCDNVKIDSPSDDLDLVIGISGLSGFGEKGARPSFVFASLLSQKDSDDKRS